MFLRCAGSRYDLVVKKIQHVSTDACVKTFIYIRVAVSLRLVSLFDHDGSIVWEGSSGNDFHLDIFKSRVPDGF